MFGLKGAGLIAVALVTLSLAGCSQADGKSAALPDDMTMGRPNAKITVVEYASVACPICGHWHKQVYPAFKAKYIDTGKVRFVYREMLVGNQGGPPPRRDSFWPGAPARTATSPLSTPSTTASPACSTTPGACF